MKKLISTIFFTILLFSCLSLTVFAETSAAISEDYQTLSIDGKSYSRIDASVLGIDYYETYDKQIDLNPTQQETIKEIELSANEYKNVIHADIFFYDGAALSVDFLQKDYLEMYNNVVTGQVQEYIIDFEWPEGNTVNAKRTDLFGDSVTLTERELEWCDYYRVITQSHDGTLTAMTGALIIIEDSYYYVDIIDASLENEDYFIPYDYAELPAHKITNAALISEIQVAEEKYYEDDLGILYNDDLSETISAVFLIFVFGIVPFLIFILFLILSILAKTVYRKLFRTIYILSAVELTVFAIVAIFIIQQIHTL